MALLTRPDRGLYRREFLAMAGGGLAAASRILPAKARPVVARRLRAVAFDAFVIFDPRPIAALTETLFPGRGSELGAAWRARQFEYQWLRALSGRYADFRQTTEDALVYAARSLRLDLTPDGRDRLMQAYLRLQAWPDVPAALRSLKATGIRLAFLSNMTARMLTTGIETAGLEGLFDHVLSTDDIHTFKPDPRAYRLAIDAFRLMREEILFASFAGWDAAGARWFGYPTFWVNRLGLTGEELDPGPDGVGAGLGDLLVFMEAAARRARTPMPDESW